ncbi:hypothetical protein HRK12_18355 [Bordetella pertussis]|nr:hypothetical protein J3Q24_00215 [Bordetella pertussis]ULX91629.1 hypothetical protein HRK15_18375 [Bordetella pertussis]ULY02290.1 hypothetical protein HRK12_18355 [Bordetella pertussis]ULY09674.1 hypothetical protein HRK11_18365 [Bordetella pertussis]ULY13261.1 hypothetical protein HRK10_18370 [Bordetella pertussis]
MNWGVGDFQFLKSGSDEPCIQPIESSQLAWSSSLAQDARRTTRRVTWTRRATRSRTSA